MEIDILIGKNKCNSCSLAVATKDESPPEKWGVIFRFMIGKDEGYSAFICIECLQSFVDKAKEVKKVGEATIEKIGKGT